MVSCRLPVGFFSFLRTETSVQVTCLTNISLKHAVCPHEFPGPGLLLTSCLLSSQRRCYNARLCKWFTLFGRYSRSFPTWVPWGQKPSLTNYLNIPMVSTPGVCTWKESHRCNIPWPSGRKGASNVEGTE